MDDAREHLRRWLQGMQAAITEQHQRREKVMRSMAGGLGQYGHDDLEAVNRRIGDLEMLGHLGATLARFLAPDLLTTPTAPAACADSPAAELTAARAFEMAAQWADERANWQDATGVRYRDLAEQRGEQYSGSCRQHIFAASSIRDLARDIRLKAKDVLAGKEGP